MSDRYPRQVSGHYWPCIRAGHPRECPDCRERHEVDAAAYSSHPVYDGTSTSSHR